MSQSQKKHARLLVLSSFDQSIPAGMQQRGKHHRAEHQPSHSALTKKREAGRRGRPAAKSQLALAQRRIAAPTDTGVTVLTHIGQNFPTPLAFFTAGFRKGHRHPICVF